MDFKKHYRVFLIVLFSSLVMNGQEVADVLKNEVKVIVRYDGSNVKLRWAPTTPSAWAKGNTFGYHIERFTIAKNGEILEKPIKVDITESNLFPDPLELWEKDIEVNDYAAILAQSLYGERFEVGQMEGGLAQIINKSKEMEQRYSFGLFAADMDFYSAKKAALGLEDNTIEKDHEYLYKVTLKVPDGTDKIKSGIVSVKTQNKIEELPAPLDVYAVGDDKSILLTWEYAMFKKVFTSYFLERSEDGNNFKRLGDTPLVNLNDKPDRPSTRMFYVDTIPANNKIYYYRVQGITPFGEVSPFSKVISAQGVKKLEDVPHISRYSFDKQGSVVLEWDFEEKVEKDIIGFELNWAAQEKGPYTTVVSDIPSSSRKAIYNNPESSNYFRIVALGKNNQKTASLTSFVQTIDSIPPAKPRGLKGEVDTLGVVSLKWTANAEKDLLGYRVFRGNLENEEVSQITISPISTTSFVDTVQVRSLNSKVFYQVVAVDQRFNMSDYSEKLALQKPDVVPPSSPIFSKYSVNKEGVQLQWIRSTSDDVQHHQLYRKSSKNTEKGWELIFKSSDTTASYRDQSAITGITYRYAVFAQDKSGLQSAPSTPITITVQKNDKVKVIKGFRGIVDREAKKIDLSWRITSNQVRELIIYKNKEGEKPVLWKQLPSKIDTISDNGVNPNTVYIYQLKAITGNAQFTELEKITITY